ncbi:MAG TPA: ferritin-like domain-containing protein [Acidimicrobiales bacterium]|nr:ferritin-like domain-containing protein [Acidimicrobiales bacterium]
MSHRSDVNRDELRRQLAQSQRDHVESLPRVREALKRVFDPDRPGTTDEKTALLGLPGRRTFLAVGGAAVVGSAVLAACGKEPTNQIAQTGTTPPQPSSTTTTAPGNHETDLTLLRTASSIEVLAVNTYATALKSGIQLSSDVKSAITLFQSQHEDHANLLYTATTDAGGTPYEQPNEYLSYEVVEPTLKTTKDEAGVLALATELENTAGQTYVMAGGVLTTPQLRAAIMSIGTTEGRHLTALYLLQGLVPVPLSIFSTAKATPPDSYIGPKGPVKPIDQLPTPTTAASS